MKNFREIAEKCLAGESSGTFIFQNGQTIISSKLRKFSNDSMHDDYIYYFDKVCTLDHHGFGYNASYNIINFIPDNMQNKIKIDIPEGKVPVMEQTENGVVITWKEKELTYEDIVKTSKGNFPYSYVRDLLSLTGQQAVRSSAKTTEDNFYKKVEVLRKLTNIRNYFGTPTGGLGYIVSERGPEQVGISYNRLPIFAKKEHAKQAIKMLGDELKYVFEPW